MKPTIASLGFALFLLFSAGCNNDPGYTANNSDTSAMQNNAPGNEAASANNGGELMSEMNEMMEDMKKEDLTGDFDVDFTKLMIKHHQGGIDMAEVETSKGTDAQLKAKAQEIINKQKEEQQQLKDFLDSYKPSGMKHGEGELQKVMQQSEAKMKSMALTGNVDKDFAAMMIHHHEDGIAMERLLLEHSMSDKLKAMAKKSIEHQQKDIQELKAWQNNQQ